MMKMNEILRKTVVRSSDGRHLLISTIERPEWVISGRGYRYETIVFECDEDGVAMSWEEIDYDLYMDKKYALWGHEAMCDAHGKRMKEII